MATMGSSNDIVEFRPDDRPNVCNAGDELAATQPRVRQCGCDTAANQREKHSRLCGEQSVRDAREQRASVGCAALGRRGRWVFHTAVAAGVAVAVSAQQR